MISWWFPSFASALTAHELIVRIEIKLLNPAIKLGFAVAIIIFVYGVVEFIQGAESEDKRTTGKTHMMYGIIGLFIMVAAGAIMNIVCGTLGPNVDPNCSPF